MKSEVRQIVGKRVTGIIVKHANEPSHQPSSMLMLVFDDGTYYEFYTHGGRLRPRQVWKMEGTEQLRQWGEDQLHTELITWEDESSGEVRLQKMLDDGHLKEY